MLTNVETVVLCAIEKKKEDNVIPHPLHSAHLICVGFICVFMCVFAQQLTQRELGQTHSEGSVL